MSVKSRRRPVRVGLISEDARSILATWDDGTTREASLVDVENLLSIEVLTVRGRAFDPAKLYLFPDTIPQSSGATLVFVLPTHLFGLPLEACSPDVDADGWNESQSFITRIPNTQLLEIRDIAETTILPRRLIIVFLPLSARSNIGVDVEFGRIAARLTHESTLALPARLLCATTGYNEKVVREWAQPNDSVQVMGLDEIPGAVANCRKDWGEVTIVFHLAGHANADGSVPDLDRSVTTDYARQIGNTIEAIKPDLILANCCHGWQVLERSARINSAPRNVSSVDGPKAIIASHYMLDGVSATDFASVFYDELLQGEPVGRAVAEARSQSGARWLYQFAGRPYVGFGAVPDGTVESEEGKDVEPYVGLRSFTRRDSPVYFGRTNTIRKLTRLLRSDAESAVFLVGASGVGKSSLIAAGLLPLVMRRHSELDHIDLSQPDVKKWLGSLLEGIAQVPVLGADVQAQIQERMSLGGPAAWLACQNAIVTALENTTRQILVSIDGLERLRLANDEHESASIVSDLVVCIERLLSVRNRLGRPAVLLIATARVDALDWLATIFSCKSLPGATYYLGPLTRAELEETVLGPLRVSGRVRAENKEQFSETLLEATSELIGEVEASPGTLPLLQWFSLTAYGCLVDEKPIPESPEDAFDEFCETAHERASLAARARSERWNKTAEGRLLLSLVRVERDSRGWHFLPRPVSTSAIGQLIDTDSYEIIQAGRAFLCALSGAEGVLRETRSPGVEVFEFVHSFVIQHWRRVSRLLRDEDALFMGGEFLDRYEDWERNLRVLPRRPPLRLVRFVTRNPWMAMTSFSHKTFAAELLRVHSRLRQKVIGLVLGVLVCFAVPSAVILGLRGISSMRAELSNELQECTREKSDKMSPECISGFKSAAKWSRLICKAGSAVCVSQLPELIPGTIWARWTEVTTHRPRVKDVWTPGPIPTLSSDESRTWFYESTTGRWLHFENRAQSLSESARGVIVGTQRLTLTESVQLLGDRYVYHRWPQSMCNGRESRIIPDIGNTYQRVELEFNTVCIEQIGLLDDGRTEITRFVRFRDNSSCPSDTVRVSMLWDENRFLTWCMGSSAICSNYYGTDSTARLLSLTDPQQSRSFDSVFHVFPLHRVVVSQAKSRDDPGLLVRGKEEIALPSNSKLEFVSCTEGPELAACALKTSDCKIFGSSLVLNDGYASLVPTPSLGVVRGGRDLAGIYGSEYVVRNVDGERVASWTPWLVSPLGLSVGRGRYGTGGTIVIGLPEKATNGPERWIGSAWYSTVTDTKRIATVLSYEETETVTQKTGVRLTDVGADWARPDLLPCAADEDASAWPEGVVCRRDGFELLASGRVSRPCRGRILGGRHHLWSAGKPVLAPGESLLSCDVKEDGVSILARDGGQARLRVVLPTGIRDTAIHLPDGERLVVGTIVGNEALLLSEAESNYFAVIVRDGAERERFQLGVECVATPGTLSFGRTPDGKAFVAVASGNQVCIYSKGDPTRTLPLAGSWVGSIKPDWRFSNSQWSAVRAGWLDRDDGSAWMAIPVASEVALLEFRRAEWRRMALIGSRERNDILGAAEFVAPNRIRTTSVEGDGTWEMTLPPTDLESLMKEFDAGGR